MKRGISQETLKLIACLTMLVDHVGAIFIPVSILRDIGRISFPIFCFLLAEGVHHTRNPWKYALRLFVGMLLSELPFDYAFFGRAAWYHQNVMLTLLLGMLALCAIRRTGSLAMKMVIATFFVVLADALYADYGGMGVMLILLFGLGRELEHRNLMYFLGMLALFGISPGIIVLRLGTIAITQQMLGAAAIIPIALYSGEKKTSGKAAQLGFYLFYPVHLAVLCLMK